MANMNVIDTDNLKEAIGNILYYYLISAQGVVENPKREALRLTAEAIEMAEKDMMTDLMTLSMSDQNTYIESLKACKTLLDNMVKAEKMDLDSVALISGIITRLIGVSEESLQRLAQSNIEIEEEAESDE